MIKLSRDQLLGRWDVLPTSLKETLYSNVNSDFLWQACEAEHIPDKKIYDIARIVGYVLMGFLHPEGMANEMRDALGIDIRIATSIANTINQRIFAPIRTDIDKVYNPSAGETSMPKIIEEIRPPVAELIPTSVPASLDEFTRLGKIWRLFQRPRQNLSFSRRNRFHGQYRTRRI